MRGSPDAVEFLCVNIASLNTEISDPAWPASVKALTSAEPFADAWYRLRIRQLHEIAEDADVPGGLRLTTPHGPHWPGGPPVPRVAGGSAPGTPARALS